MRRRFKSRRRPSRGVSRRRKSTSQYKKRGFRIKRYGSSRGGIRL